MKPIIWLNRVKTLTSDIDLLHFNEGEHLEAVEYCDKSLVFQFPQIKLSLGNLVALGCTLQIDSDEKPFPTTGKIIACDANEDRISMRVRIDLRQFDKHLWSEFLEISQQAQDRVDRLFAEIKGE